MRKKINIFVSLLLLLTALVSPLTAVKASSPESENIIVRIQYVYNDADQTVAAQAYEAKVPVGYDKVEKVNSPEVKGYLPDQKVITLDFKQFTKDTTLTVKYYPLKVPYQVEHQVENLSRDAFVAQSTDTLYAYVHAMVTAEPKTLEGFTPIPPYQTEKVPAEGTLKLIIKYSRNIYTLSYDTDGGSYVPSEQHVFEGKIAKPNDPVKSGYTFGGWEPALPDTMPANDLKLKATWLEDQSKYKYAYMLQNADDDNYTLIGYTDETAKTNSPVIIPQDGAGPLHINFFPVKNYAGFTFNNPQYFGKYFVFNQKKTLDENAGKTISGDNTTIVPLYFTRRVYTVVFGNNPSYYNDPNAYFPELKIGGKVYTRDNPYKIKVRYRQDFSALMPEESNISNLPAGEHLTGRLYVKGSGYGSWMTKKPPYVFNEHMAYCAPQTLVDLSQDENFPYTQYISLDISVPKNKLDIYEHFQKPDGSYDELSTPTRIEALEGGAWYYSGAAYKGFLNDSQYMDYYRHGNEAPSSGFLIRRHGKPSLSAGDVLLNPDGTVKETITESWDSNADGEVRVYLARKAFPVRFYIDPDKQSEDLTKNLLYEAPLSSALPGLDVINQKKPKNLPARYEFKGWYKDLLYQEELESNAIMGTDAVTLFAKWGPPSGKIIITVKTDNGSPDSMLKVSYDGAIKQDQLGVPQKAGYTFIGWYVLDKNGNSNTIYDFSRKLTDDITLLAKYRRNTIAPVTVKYLNDSGEPVAPEKTFQNLPVGLDYTYKAELVDGMLPDSLSKEITVDADPAKNVLVFNYKPFTTIDYKVRFVIRFLDSQGNIIEKEIAKAENVTTDRNIDTQDYKPIKGYTPLTLKQTLSFSQRAEDNVMTFVYMAKNDPETTEYKIQYYFADNGSYAIDESRTLVLSGKVGEVVTLNLDYMPEYINGYKLNKAKSVNRAVITSFGTLKFKLYYDKAEKPSDNTTGKTTKPTTTTKVHAATTTLAKKPTVKVPSQGLGPTRHVPGDKTLTGTGETSNLVLPIILISLACALVLRVVFFRKKNTTD